MIKESLFAAEEREAKLDQLGDVLQLLEKQVDMKAKRQWPSLSCHKTAKSTRSR